MRKITKRTAAFAAAAVIGIGATGIAWAAWTTDATGSAAAAAGTAAPAVVSAGSVTGDPLVPGATRDLKFSVANPNAFPIRVTSVKLTDDLSVDDADLFSVEVSGGLNEADCQGTVPANGPKGRTGVKFTGGSDTITLAAPVDLAANAGATVVTVPAAVTMTNDSDNGCQGAAFSLDLAVASASNA